jgi:regulator of PEP synthase PpsR (kinase-PPPase family)
VVCRAEDGKGATSKEDIAFLMEVLPETVLILQKTDKDLIKRLAGNMEEVRVKAGEVVVHQGDQIGSLYIVVEGELDRELLEADAVEPLRTPIGSGSFFGATTLLGNTVQRTTVVANTEDVRLFRLDREVFDEVIFGRDPAGEKKVAAIPDEPKAEAADSDEDSDYDDDDIDSDDEGMSCDFQSMKEVFVVSDSTGESASSSVRTAMQQFNYCFGDTCGTSKTTVYRFVRSEGEVKKIVELAKERDAMVVFTVMLPQVNKVLVKTCEDEGVDYVDLWGGLLTHLETKFGAKRSGVYGRKQVVSEDYMQTVRAIEYTRKVDDGVLPHVWKECDVMLIGPSRAGKTPLSFYLAQRGYKVANYPLVPDEEPPKELFELDQNKCFGLMISAQKLQSIRMERMRQFNRVNTDYANMANIKKEVAWIRTFYIRRGCKWPVIDTSESGVAETASRIIEILDRRKGDALAAAYVDKASAQ